LGLGSNVGDSLELLNKAFRALSDILEDFRVSAIYRTKACYVLDQPDYYNAVVCGQTALSATDLLAKTQALEASLGRNRKLEQPKGPRTMDIDILLYGSQHIKVEKLEIPHPGIMERTFVLKPLLDLAPELRHPLSNVAFSEMLVDLDDGGVILVETSGEHFYA
jgi:2-amino-4-hydroxy-6-hydroxymethyldihydropteridine diphosphokinase